VATALDTARAYVSYSCLQWFLFEIIRHILEPMLGAACYFKRKRSTASGTVITLVDMLKVVCSFLESLVLNIKLLQLLSWQVSPKSGSVGICQ
jgi:hypothetical protein